MSKLNRRIIFGEELEHEIRAGVRSVYEVAAAAYGPGAGNAIIELEYGDPLISRDGVTNVDKVYLEEPAQNMAARAVVQASKKNNRKVGDGTTGVIILAYWLYEAARSLVNAGHNRMEVSRLLEQVADTAGKQLDALKIDVTDELLKQVAIISAGNPQVGEMIADVISEIGIDGGVTIEDFPGVGIYNELVDGFYFRKGFTNINLINDPANLESRHDNADILITDKRMATTSDIAPILEKIISVGGKGKELILVGDVSDEVLSLLLLNRLKGIVNVTVTDMPVYGPMRSLALEDLALITGGTVFNAGSASDFTVDMLGGAAKVVINEFSTTIIDGEGSQASRDNRIKELHNQLAEAESSTSVEAIKERLARISGKVAIISVGGATDIEQSEVKLRVQDAVCAVQAAIREGIVPGAGVALAHIKTGHPILDRAFKRPFRLLVENAGFNSAAALHALEGADNWQGYDLRHDLEATNYSTVDLLAVGVIDPAQVVNEMVRNAVSVTAKLITAGVGLTLVNRDQKHD